MTTVSGVRHGPTNRRPAAPKKAMFAFLAPQAKDLSDPLQNAKAAATWLRPLPSLDVIGRQQQVIAVLDAMRKAQRAPDLNRINAVQFVDAALGADRRQLIKQYIENAESSPKLADRIWQALWEMSQEFTLTYQAALESALTQAANARWKRSCLCSSCAWCISMAPMPSCACSSTNAGFPRSGSSCTRFICAPASSPAIASRWRCPRRVPAPRLGRSSRNTCTCCSCTSSTPAILGPLKSIGRAR